MEKRKSRGHVPEELGEEELGVVAGGLQHIAVIDDLPGAPIALQEFGVPGQDLPQTAPLAEDAR